MFLIIVHFRFDKSLNREYKPKQVNRREWRICQLKKLFWKLFFRCKGISIRTSIITQASENTSDQRIGTTTQERRNVFLIGEEGSQASSGGANLWGAWGILPQKFLNLEENLSPPPGPSGSAVPDICGRRIQLPWHLSATSNFETNLQSTLSFQST